MPIALGIIIFVFAVMFIFAITKQENRFVKTLVSGGISLNLKKSSKLITRHSITENPITGIEYNEDRNVFVIQRIKGSMELDASDLTIDEKVRFVREFSDSFNH